ncbi:MAG: TRAP transporter small permease subunit [Clostridiales Family XIII bacterium]|jgi:TRAP-type C4-dicarboxylate transport system permease small subunit|nr:TRAP transporter small permease subunit [Clostridiales Family XIII bacterium]
MKYPPLLEKLNLYLSRVSGLLLFLIAAFAVFEAIARSFFASPTIWTADISSYMLLCALFLGLSYTYQENGHVAVDIMKNAFVRLFGERGYMIINLFNYIISFVVTVVLIRGVLHVMESAARFGQLTNANIQIPVVFLYVIMLVGSVLMALTVIFIVIDIISGGKKYL